jgi:hypothetical protein
VLKTKGNKLLVKWMGYSDDFNSWIDKKDAMSIGDGVRTVMHQICAQLINKMNSILILILILILNAVCTDLFYGNIQHKNKINLTYYANANLSYYADVFGLKMFIPA